ncbi:restriction endonuclease subunit S [Citrobacter farmeri]|uniref:restriction endonuclease subunit S n=1 Tax=Citrobacter farmeri TaxID=67824 RepID=UPI001F3CB5FA|nr:restriction endonuclease subunit S [Citrobacter farmeri]
MVPKLRFKNFEGIWEPKSLKDIACLTSSKRVHLSDYVKEGIPFFRGKEITELKSGIIPSDILYISPLLFNEFKVKYGTPKAGEILITAVGTLGNIYHINNIGDFYFKDGNLIWLKELKCNSLFLSFLLTFKKNEILNSAIGSTQKALTMVELNKLVFNYPRNDEQVKIASFLSLLEEKITLLNKQYNLLCQYKKGMMQKIFSQELRFKDDSGDEFPEWEELELKQIAIKVNTKNRDNSVTTVLTNSATQGIVSQESYFEREIVTESNLTGYYVVRIGDFVYNPRISSTAPVGPIKMNELTQGVMSPLYTVFRFKKGLLKFYQYFFESSVWHEYMKSVANSGARHDRMNISGEDFFGLPVPQPFEEEQTKIANFLSALDDKIAVKKAELDKLKTWKQGLLQQMFV